MKRPPRALSAPLTLVAILLSIVTASVVATPSWSTDVLPTEVQITRSADTTTLPRSATRPTGVKAYASAAYVHEANCFSALQGANGDNDVAAYMAAHPSIYAWGFRGSTRYSSTRLIAWIAFFWHTGAGYSVEPGYCMGDDSNITDKVADAPSGW